METGITLNQIDDISVTATNLIKEEFEDFDTPFPPPKVTPGMVKNVIKASAQSGLDIRERLTGEERFIAESITAARKIQTMLWGESNGSWGLEEWRRMFVKRYVKIELIDPSNPHAIVELKKRLLQNSALSIALIAILHFGRPVDIVNDKIPSNLPEYAETNGPGAGKPPGPGIRTPSGQKETTNIR